MPIDKQWIRLEGMGGFDQSRQCFSRPIGLRGVDDPSRNPTFWVHMDFHSDLGLGSFALLLSEREKLPLCVANDRTHTTLDLGTFFMFDRLDKSRDRSGLRFG